MSCRLVAKVLLCLAPVFICTAVMAQPVDITTIGGLDDLTIEAAEGVIVLPGGQDYYIPHGGADLVNGQILLIEAGAGLTIPAGVTISTNNEFRQIFPSPVTALLSPQIQSNGNTSDGACFIRVQGDLTAGAGVTFDRVPIAFESETAPGSATGTLDDCIFIESPVAIKESSPSIQNGDFDVSSYNYEINTPIFFDNFGIDSSPDLTGVDISDCTTQAIGVGNMLMTQDRSSGDDVRVDQDYTVPLYPTIFGTTTDYLLQGDVHIMPTSTLTIQDSGADTIRVRSEHTEDAIVHEIVNDGILVADNVIFDYVSVRFEVLSDGSITDCDFNESPVRISSASPVITGNTFHVTEYVSEVNYPIFLENLGQGTRGAGVTGDLDITDNDFSASTVQGVGTSGRADSNANLPVTVIDFPGALPEDNLSLYILVDDAYVHPGVTFTIDPGVTLTTDPNDETPEILEVRGTMTATDVTFNQIPISCLPGGTIVIDGDTGIDGTSMLNDSTMSVNAGSLTLTDTIINSTAAYPISVARLGEGSALTVTDNTLTSGTKRSIATYGVVNGSATLPYVPDMPSYTLVEFFGGEQVESVVNFGATLTIEPGVSITTQAATMTKLYVDGTLIAQGDDIYDINGVIDPNEAISFLRLPVVFRTLSAGTFENAKIVGSPMHLSYSSPSFTNCVIATQGITAVTADNSSAAFFDGCDFIGSGVGIRNLDGNTLITATDSFWGRADGPSGHGDGTGVAVFGVDNDGDGTIDNITFPNAAADFVNTDLLDYDGDGILEVDADGVPAAANENDSDVTVDDDDADEDALPTLIEDVNADGFLDSGETDPAVSDTDGDGVVDGRDAFPTDPEEQFDTDSDGLGNNTDSDDDGDGVSDIFDAFPLDPNEDTDTDGDGIGDNSDGDIDGDDIPNELDPNPFEPDLASIDPSTISTNITESRTLTLENSPYTVFGQVEILSDAVLTVSAGVVVRAPNPFGTSDNALLVNAGELDADGATMEHLPITFGLAGLGTINNCVLDESTITIDRSSPTITNNTFIVTSFGGLIITPLSITNGGEVANPTISGNDYSQSTTQAIGTFGSVLESATMALYDGLPYLLTETLNVGAGVTLTVEDDVRITRSHGDNEYKLTVDGTLEATSAGAPGIIFDHVPISFTPLSAATIAGCTFMESPVTIESASVDIQGSTMSVTESVSNMAYPIFVADLAQGCTLVLADNDFSASTLPGIGTGGTANSNATLPVTTPALQDTSLYILTEDTEVSPGVTLTLENGVELVADPTNQSKEALTVRGTMNGDDIILRDLTLVFAPGSDGTITNSTIIETPIDIEGASPTITDCIIESLEVLPFILKNLGEGSDPTISGTDLVGESPRVIGTYGSVNGTAILPYIAGWSYTLLKFDRGEQTATVVRHGASLEFESGVVLAGAFENSVLGTAGADPDTDGDGTPNSRDIDDDNDGIIDSLDPLPLDPGSGIDDDAGKRGIIVRGHIDITNAAIGRTGIFLEPLSSGVFTNSKLVGSRIELNFAADLTVTNCAIVPQGVISVVAGSRSTVNIADCDIFPRGIGVLNTDATTTVMAENNYWADSDGPSGDGPGLGAGAFGNVDFTPFADTFINTVLIQPLIDTDGDGLPDSIEDLDGNSVTDAGETSSTNRDTDGDATPDGDDPFPLDDSEWRDTDNDGVGDNTDNDDDGDGYLDYEDALPLDATEHLDTDGDGVGNNADLDDDDDGIPDADDPNPLVYDETAIDDDPSVLIGTIVEDRTLQPLPDDQPYTLKGEVRIKSGVTLTILEDVIIETENGFDEITNRLVVATGGTLSADDSVTFTSLPIFFEELAEGTINDCTLRESFIVLRGASPTITNNLFDFVSFGDTVNVPIMMDNIGEGSAPTITDNSFARDATVAIGLRGSASEDVILTRYAGIPRYLLFEDVTVMPGGSLAIEPNVIIGSAGDDVFSIQVEGALVADGTGKASDGDLSDNIVFDRAPVVFLPVSVGTIDQSVFIDSPVSLNAASPSITNCFFTLDPTDKTGADGYPIFVNNLGQGCDPSIDGNEFSSATRRRIGTSGTATTDARLNGTGDLSIYIVTEPSYIAEAATLTVGEDVQIRGLDYTEKTLFVNGALDATDAEFRTLSIQFSPFSGGTITGSIFNTSPISIDFASPEFTDCIFRGTGQHHVIYVENDGTPIINNSDFVGSMSYGINCDNTSALVNAEYNWWGAASGPGFAGPGIGESVSIGVDYSPWLDEPNAASLTADFDGDYTVDFFDNDNDNDGVDDDDDPMPFDTDNDGLNNDVDPDDDADGINDIDDDRPFDTDNDGLANKYDYDDDNDGLSDEMERLFGTDSLNPDTDGDDLNDFGEFLAGTDPLKIDSDGDGLSDGSDGGPLSSDTDDDGLNDGDEVNIYGTDPSRADTDGDGLGDFEELFTYDTDPTDRDTDGGGDGDGTEVFRGTDPLDAGDDNGDDADSDGLTDTDEWVLGTDPNSNDTDLDGLHDGQEVSIGTNPLEADTDGDGLDDAREVLELGTDPIEADTDGDRLTDKQELDYRGTDPLEADTDGDGLDDGEEALDLQTNPLEADTDGGGNDDGTEVFYGLDPLDPDDDNDLDTDGDGLSDFDEMTYGTDINRADTDRDGLTDFEEVEGGTSPISIDTDGDGLTDYIEVRDRLTDPNDEDTDDDGLTDAEEVLSYATNPLNADTDGDGLDDGEEIEIGTSPRMRDSDGDGFTDGEEFLVGSDPTDANDMPVTDPDVTLVIGTATCPLLLTTDVDITIASTETQPASLRVDIIYDETVVTPAGMTPGAAATAAGSDLRMAIVAPGQARLTVLAGDAPIGDGLLATVTFRARPGQTEGTVTALMGAERVAYTEDLVELEMDVVSGSIELLPDAADINGDGFVNAIDIQKAINQLLGLGADPGDGIADVNNDGIVNSADVQALTNRLLGV